MNRKLFALTLPLAALVNIAPTVTRAASDPVPCEKMLGDLKAAIAAAKHSDADKATVMDLQAKGLERCKADDDAGADAFFAGAMKLVGGK